jgi:hypothetical protein
VKERILLIASVDETYRKPLLETQGYQVDSANITNAEESLRSATYKAVLLATDVDGIALLDLCGRVKKAQPHARVGVLAQRAEYIPPNDCIDAIFRNQHSPGKFLSALRTLMSLSPGEKPSNADSED